jgi:uncharacterized membrane protein
MSIESFRIIEPIWVFIIGILISIIPYLTEKSIIFGVRVPTAQINSDTVKKMKKIYVSITFILTIVLTVLTYLLSSYLFVVAFMPLFMVLIEFMVYLPEHYSLERLKRNEHWTFNPGSVTGIFSIEGENRFPWFFAIPGILVIFSIFVTGALDYKSIPERFATHYNASGVANAYSTKSIESVFILGFISIIITLLMIIIAYTIARTPLKTDNASPNGTERVIIFQERMVYLTLLAPAFINSSLLIGSFGEWGIIKENIFLILIPVFLLIIFVIAISIKTGQLGSNVKIAGSTEPETTIPDNSVSDNKNDDSLWKAGVMYWNKNDPRIMVPKRFGVGYTVNFAHPAGKVILVLIIAVPVIIVISVLLH